MNFEEYLPTVAQRCKPLPHREHLAHMAMGVVGEFGEVCEMIKKHTIYGKELDRDKLLLEVGDICWYVGGFATGLGVSPHLMEVAFNHGEQIGMDSPDTEFIVALSSVAGKVSSELTEVVDEYPAEGIEGVMILCELLGMVCCRFSLKLEEVLARNDAKLAARYKEKFDAKQAIERKDTQPADPCACSSTADCPKTCEPVMGGIETPALAAKWDGHGTAYQSNTGPGPSPETEAFWDDKLRTLEKHNANDKDTPRME